MNRPSPGRLPPLGTITPGKVSIVVLNWNARPFVERALESIVRHTSGTYELVLVDNGSTDGSKQYVHEFIASHPDVDVRHLDHSDNLYFSRGFNEGFRASAADSEFVVVFCNDVEVKTAGWLEDLVEAMRDPHTIAAGHAAEDYPLPREHREIFERNEPHYPDPSLARAMRDAMNDPDFTYTHLYGYCFILRKALLAACGLYLEGGDFQQYHSDWEWYIRFAALNHPVVSAPPKVHHWHSVSELVAFHPERYRDLVARLDDPTEVARALRVGRELYPEESGYRVRRRQATEGGGG